MPRFFSLAGSALLLSFSFGLACIAGGRTVAFAAPAASSPAVFRLHLSKEPSTLDPHLESSSGSGYALQNLYRNLFRFRDAEGLIPDLAESCKRQGTFVLVCTLKKDLHWSDGSALTAGDFLTSYQRILDRNQKAPRADLLFPIKNAKAIYSGEKESKTLGVTAPDPRTLRFELENGDSEFEYALINTMTAPIKNKNFTAKLATSLVTSGPYKVAEWTAGEKLVLASNPFYDGGNNKSRPSVEFLFISEDSVALQLYEKGSLSFLRRLPTLYIPQFKKRPDFHWIPVTRFDYLGFGPALKELSNVREALTYSLNYEELQKILSSEGVPGCPGIPKSWLKKELCYKEDLPRAKASIKKASTVPSLTMTYSVLGGDDHRRLAEWLQSQWQKNLGLNVQTQGRENKVFLSELGANPPAIFRKGATPDRPTCLAALSTFAAESPDNYIQLKEPAFAVILKKLASADTEKKRRSVCAEGIRFLMERHVFIPTGPIHFSMLAKQNFKGWDVNTLNQLDLGALSEQK